MNEVCVSRAAIVGCNVRGWQPLLCRAIKILCINGFHLHEKVIYILKRSIGVDVRRKILEKYCSYMEMGNHYWEYEDNCTLNNGTDIDILHRTTAFLESYFDIIFALNRLTHPGEKRLVELCKKNCVILPERFEENLNQLFDDMGQNADNVNADIRIIVDELEKIL